VATLLVIKPDSRLSEAIESVIDRRHQNGR